MAVKFKITPSRVAEVCNIAEYLLLDGGSKDTAIRVANRFVVNKDGEYIVKVVYDDDGDIKEFQGMAEAFQVMASVTPQRMEKLAKEMTEAVKNIVNPPSAGA